MRVALLAILTFPASAATQAPPSYSPTMNEPNYSTVVMVPHVPRWQADSLALRQKKLAAALALKAKAVVLLEGNNGKFTRQNEDYIRRKASAILAWTD